MKKTKSKEKDTDENQQHSEMVDSVNEEAN